MRRRRRIESSGRSSRLEGEVEAYLSSGPGPGDSYRSGVAYRLKLTPGELEAVRAARGRYAWADMLATHAAEDGSVGFSESEMRAWTDDVDSDTSGGHSPFPMAPSGLVDKLQRFHDERV